MWDPHIKAFLLLQAYFSRSELPISDYVGDQTSVLDQSIRIIQAAIDVLAELGYFSSCATMITLMQCVKSARWPTDDPASILPGVLATPPDPASGRHELVSVASQAATAQRADEVAGSLNVPRAARAEFSAALARLPRLAPAVERVTAAELEVKLSRLNSDGLRYDDEFVKHKILDAIGDMMTAGKPFLASYRAYKSGHALNNKLVRALLSDSSAFEVVTFDDESRAPAGFAELAPAW